MHTKVTAITFGESTNQRFADQRLLIVGAMLLLALVVSACSGGSSSQSTDAAAPAAASGSTITIDELPEGLGRGLPTATLQDAAEKGVGVRSGDLPPNFQLTLEDGSSLSLRDLQGRPVMINFWATWCGPCRLEMPDIVEQAEANQDIVVIAVNVGEKRDAVQSFVEEFQMSMPVARDVEDTLRKAYQVRGMPTSVFIDSDGRISTIWSGLLTGDKLQELLDEIL